MLLFSLAALSRCGGGIRNQLGRLEPSRITFCDTIPGFSSPWPVHSSIIRRQVSSRAEVDMATCSKDTYCILQMQAFNNLSINMYSILYMHVHWMGLYLPLGYALDLASNVHQSSGHHQVVDSLDQYPAVVRCSLPQTLL